MKDMETKAREKAKRKRAADKEARDAHLRGHPVTKWTKGSRVVEVEPATGANRKNKREVIFELATKERFERMPATSNNKGHMSRYSKVPLSRRAGRRHRRERAARRARRLNRR